MPGDFAQNQKDNSGETIIVRAIIAVLDSLGFGASDDAEEYGDLGADTFGHIAEAAARGDAAAEPVQYEQGSLL